MAADEKEIRKNLKILKKWRESREATWNDIIDYIFPGLESLDVWKKDDIGKRIGKNRYDGSGVSALQLFADGLYGYYIAPSIAWLKLRMKDELMEIPAVRQWLQSVEEHYYGVFNRSNFYDSISMYFEYAPALGFAVMYCEEDMNEEKIVFHVYHPGECYLSEDKYNRVDTVYRECRYDARTAIQKFGENNVTDELKRAATIKGQDSYQQFDFVHAVYPRSDRQLGRIDAKNKKFASVWMQVSGGIKNPDGKIVKESGYDRFPYHVWRFKKGTTPYGRGPAEDALIEVIGSNVISKSLLLAAEKSVNPPMNIPVELEGKVELTPGGFNYITDPKNAKIEPVSQGIDFPIGIDREERIQKAIERHFKVEFFTLLAALEGQAKTATEIIELAGEKAAVLSRPLTRLNSECLDPIIDAVFDIELRSGRLPEPPTILQEMSGEPIEVDYMGPLAQAQKKHFQVQGIEQSIAVAGPIFEINPASADVIDWDGALIDTLKVTGFPQKRINTPEVIKRIRQARANVEERETAKEDLSQMAQMTESLAKADKATGGKVEEALTNAGEI